MLTKKEREAVAGFRQWAKALRDDDRDTLRKIEREWNQEFTPQINGSLSGYRKGSF